jgi:hypothetical protein
VLDEPPPGRRIPGGCWRLFKAQVARLKVLRRRNAWQKQGTGQQESGGDGRQILANMHQWHLVS